MEIKSDYFVLLYSESQDTYIADTLSGTVKKNMDAFINGRSSDYMLVGMADTKDELQRCQNRLIAFREKHQEKNHDPDLPEPQRIS